MFIPSAILGMWFRNVLGIAFILAAIWLFAEWYRELPTQRVIVDRIESEEVADVRQTAVEVISPYERVIHWRPGLDRATAMLGGTILLSILSLGGGRALYPMLRRTGTDDPVAAHSDRTTRLRRPDGTELQIEEFGLASGPVVLCTHGWGVDSTEWYYLKKALAQEYRLVLWDLPGLGRSTRALNNNYELERFAHDLHAVIEWTNASNVVLVGHSIGGMILQTYARLYPTAPNVRGLAIVHSSYKNPIRTTQFNAFYTAIEMPVIVPLLYLTIALSPLVWLMNLVSFLNGSAHRSTEKQSFSGGETRGQLNFATRYNLMPSPGVLARGMLAMTRFDETQHLASITLPVLVVAGENDPVTLADASKYISSHIPHGVYVEIPTARHQGHMEFHSAFLGALRGFLQKTLTSDTVLAERSLAKMIK